MKNEKGRDAWTIIDELIREVSELDPRNALEVMPRSDDEMQQFVEVMPEGKEAVLDDFIHHCKHLIEVQKIEELIQIEAQLSDVVEHLSTREVEYEDELTRARTRANIEEKDGWWDDPNSGVDQLAALLQGLAGIIARESGKLKAVRQVLSEDLTSFCSSHFGRRLETEPLTTQWEDEMIAMGQSWLSGKITGRKRLEAIEEFEGTVSRHAVAASLLERLPRFRQWLNEAKRSADNSTFDELRECRNSVYVEWLQKNVYAARGMTWEQVYDWCCENGVARHKNFKSFETARLRTQKRRERTHQ